MTWDKGFNFRDTVGFVTDNANETYVATGAMSYPQTRNSVTFGWLDAFVDGGQANRNAGIDVRLAGIHYTDNISGGGKRFQVDLPAAGDYLVRVALGDASFTQDGQFWELLDNTSSLATVVDTGGTLLGHFDDATGTDYDTASWPGSNTGITRTFATTTLIIKVGSSGGLGVSTITHLFVSQVVSPVEPERLVLAPQITSFRRRVHAIGY